MTTGVSFWADMVAVLEMPGMWILLAVLVVLILLNVHSWFDMGPRITYVKGTPTHPSTVLTPVSQERGVRVHAAFHRPRTIKPGPRLIGRSSTIDPKRQP